MSCLGSEHFFVFENWNIKISLNWALNELEMPATPTNRGWINGVAAISRQKTAIFFKPFAYRYIIPCNRDLFFLGNVEKMFRHSFFCYLGVESHHTETSNIGIFDFLLHCLAISLWSRRSWSIFEQNSLKIQGKSSISQVMNPQNEFQTSNFKMVYWKN